ncbi:response regulator [Selenomonas sp. TAMA-11512]|uniref:response regulator transcription factor n=1 Tax=Selenomonas sp. TAMA-11512 TaxID=3095337 RepID=UPI0030876FF6|nr:response regulator [Selenomonas sp. TAMA-11512]
MKRVVVIDDESIQRQSLVSLTPWSDVGCRVVGEAENAESGAALIRQLQPDIALVDITMPGRSGLDMIEELMEECSVEYVVLSGYGEFSYAQRAMQLGVRNYLLKPVEDEELLEAMRKAAEHVDGEKKRRALELGLREERPFYEHFGRGESKNKYLEKAIRYMEENCSLNLTIQEVSRIVDISPSYLHRLFTEHTEYTFGEYLTLCRMRKAIRLLSAGELRIYEVAEACGYKDTRYFSNVFRRVTGVKPTEYRDGKIMS